MTLKFTLETQSGLLESISSMIRDLVSAEWLNENGKSLERKPVIFQDYLNS